VERWQESHLNRASGSHEVRGLDSTVS